MSPITVTVTDTQGKTHIFDKPVSFDITKDPFLFGLERGRKEAAMECLAIFNEYFDKAGYKAGASYVCGEIVKKFKLEW